MRFLSCCFIISIIIFSGADAQSLLQHNVFEAGVYTGSVVKNYPVFPDRNAASVINVAWYKKLAGTQAWHHSYGYPEFTLQGWYCNLGNPKVLGQLTGLTAGFRFEQRLNNYFAVSEQLQFGLAYFSMPYDEATNPGNIAIGSHFTPMPNLRLSIEYNINPFIAINASAGVLHASNGHYQLPNLGVNLPVYGIGIKYKPVPAVLINSAHENALTDKKVYLAMRVSLGMNEQGSSTWPVNGPKYPIYLSSIYLHKKYTYAARWQVGLEGYYNSGVYDFITSQDYYDAHQRAKSFAGLLIVGNEFLFGHASMVTQGGMYLYNPFYRDRYEQQYPEGDNKAWLKTWFTARLGFQYYVRKATEHPHRNLFIAWFVKTNFGQADFMEASVGYLF